MSEVKQLPPEFKTRLDEMMNETKETRDVLDALDKELFTLEHFTPETLKRISAKATGGGNYLRKKLGKLVAAVRNEEANRFLHIKLDAAVANAKITESAAQMEASAYVGPIRTAREVLNAYVTSADNIVSFCRMHNSNSNGYSPTETHNPVEV